jgi:probable addiction module antidote protein
MTKQPIPHIDDNIKQLNELLYSGKEKEFRCVLRETIKSQQGLMTQLSKEIGISRTSLYKSLDGTGEVYFSKILMILNFLGYKIHLSFTPKDS